MAENNPLELLSKVISKLEVSMSSVPWVYVKQCCQKTVFKVVFKPGFEDHYWI